MSRDTLQVALDLSRQSRQAVEAVWRETPAQEVDALAGLSAEERASLFRLLGKAFASIGAALAQRETTEDRKAGG